MYNYYSTDLLHTCQRAPGYLYKLKQANQRAKPHSHKPRQLASHLSPHPSSYHLPNTKVLLAEPPLQRGTIMPVQLSFILCSQGVSSDSYHLHCITDIWLKPAGSRDVPEKCLYLKEGTNIGKICIFMPLTMKVKHVLWCVWYIMQIVLLTWRPRGTLITDG